MTVRATPVLVTGASGFVGTHVLGELARQGYEVRALVRRPGSLRVQDAVIAEAAGSILEPGTLRAAMRGVRAVIHLVGIIAERGPEATFQRVHVEGTRHVVDAAREEGVERFVHMSALGTRANAVSRYHQTKWEAEEWVRSGGGRGVGQAAFAWTIFQPSLIHGPDGEFSRMLRGWALGTAPPYLFMPFFGTGFFGQRNEHRIAPVYVEDVARLFVDALANDGAVGQTYEVGGPRSYTWPEMLHAASRVLRGRAKAAVGIPVWWAKVLLALHAPVPFNRDQLAMSQEENVADLAKVRGDFPEVELRGFEEMMERYKGEMR